MRRGVFITVEGGDSCGKSTQLDLAAQWLREGGARVLTTREPGGTDLGVELRQLVMHGPDDVDARCEALLYAADRAYHVATRVRPALDAGMIVLQDRYIDSSIAYQGAARDLGVDEVRRLNEWASGGLWPDVTILFDIAPEVAFARMTGERDRLEREPDRFHHRVREQYLALAAANPERIRVVDAAASIEEIQRQVRAILAPYVSPFITHDSADQPDCGEGTR